MDSAVPGPDTGDLNEGDAESAEDTSGPGLTDCGRGESCCASLLVAGGTFYRTYNNTGGAPTGSGDPASVSGLRVDKCLVTVGRFRQFVDVVIPSDGGAGWLPAAGSGKHTHLNGGEGLADSTNPGSYEAGWDAYDWNALVAPTGTNLACDPNYATWTNAPGTNEDLPINCINWFESYAFCIWDGGFLPSEAEWEYASAGGSEQREYPWGSTPPGTSNMYAIYGCHYGPGGLCTGTVADMAPVGAAPLGVGRWGQLDLAGELFEWNLDVYASGYQDPCADCANLTGTSSRVVRGGAFLYGSSYLFPGNRGTDAASTRTFLGGVRCVRSP
ncbi:MAG: formylglycine-generating enzyme family protein [Polyangiaceae bacterium]